MSEWTVLGDAETVKALFQLKKAGREYRQDMTADNARQAAKQFSKAAMTAAEDEKSYAEIMRTAAGGVLDEAAARLDMAKLAELGADDEFYALFSAEAAKRFQEYLKERAKNAAEIHRAEHRAGMGGATAKADCRFYPACFYIRKTGRCAPRCSGCSSPIPSKGVWTDDRYFICGRHADRQPFRPLPARD